MTPFAHDSLSIEHKHNENSEHNQCKKLTADDNNVQMIDRNLLSCLPNKLTNHLDLNVEKYSLKMKQQTATTKE